MAKIEVNSGPHKKLIFIGHDSAEAYDQQAGQTGACVEAADLSDVYRSLLPDAHEKFATVLTKSGVARGVNADATAKAKARAKEGAKVQDVPETYTTYANRVKAAVDEETWKSLDDEIHTIAAAMRCDSSPTARQKGPDKAAVAKAQEILGRQPDAIEETVTKLMDVVPAFDLVRDAEGKPEETSLARLVQAFVEEQKKGL